MDPNYERVNRMEVFVAYEMREDEPVERVVIDVTKLVEGIDSLKSISCPIWHEPLLAGCFLFLSN